MLHPCLPAAQFERYRHINRCAAVVRDRANHIDRLRLDRCARAHCDVRNRRIGRSTIADREKDDLDTFRHGGEPCRPPAEQTLLSENPLYQQDPARTHEQADRDDRNRHLITEIRDNPGLKPYGRQYETKLPDLGQQCAGIEAVPPGAAQQTHD